MTDTTTLALVAGMVLCLFAALFLWAGERDRQHRTTTARCAMGEE